MRVGERSAFLSRWKIEGDVLKLSHWKMFSYSYLWKHVSLAFVIIKDKKISEKLSWGTQIISQTISAVLSHLHDSFGFPHEIFCHSKGGMLKFNVTNQLCLQGERKPARTPALEKS